jgi:hypothetical protein
MYKCDWYVTAEQPDQYLHPSLWKVDFMLSLSTDSIANSPLTTLFSVLVNKCHNQEAAIAEAFAQLHEQNIIES